MGDYNVLIVSAAVKLPEQMSADQFKAEVEARRPKSNSYYHATANFVSFAVDKFDAQRVTVSLITQAKWNYGVDEFLKTRRRRAYCDSEAHAC